MPMDWDKYWREHPQEWERQEELRVIRESIEHNKAVHQAEVAARKAARMAKSAARREALHQLHLNRGPTVSSGTFPRFGVRYLDKGSRNHQQRKREQFRRWKDSLDSPESAPGTA